MYFGMLTQNRIIDAALLAWFLAQLIKVIIDLILIRKFDLKRFVSSGGMPSSHSAMVAACSTAIGKIYGFDGAYFAISAVMSVIVMYDAFNVRRSAGDTARLVNQILAHVERLTAEDFAEDLKEVMGHTPLQVLLGALLGISIGILV